MFFFDLEIITQFFFSRFFHIRLISRNKTLDYFSIIIY